MTFDELVEHVMVRLNLTSDEAEARIAHHMNEAYREVTTSIGLQTSRLKEKEVTYDAQDEGSTLPYITVRGLEKILTVRLHVTGQKPKVLFQLTHEDIKSSQSDSVPSQLPMNWAEFRVGANSVTILLDAYPATDPFTLEFSGYEIADQLSGSMVPAFPESFHDLLITMVMADELYKMEKPALAETMEKKSEKRLSDLRYFLAKSQWLDVVQGQLKRRHIRGSTVINE